MIADTYTIIPGEQKTDDWQQLRMGKVTGSSAKDVKGTGDAFIDQSLAIMTTEWKPKPARGEDVDRGNELEEEARKAYEAHTGEKTLTCAFIDRGRIGYSPDAYKPGKGGKGIKKIIEIKSHDVPAHIAVIRKNRVPSKHMDQVIHAFVTVDDCDEVDFVSYCPAFRFKPLVVITVRRRDLIMDIQTAEIAYKRFIEKLDAAYQSIIL
mgnify:CR=1 FL=1